MTQGRDLSRRQTVLPAMFVRQLGKQHMISPFPGDFDQLGRKTFTPKAALLSYPQRTYVFGHHAARYPV